MNINYGANGYEIVSLLKIRKMRDTIENDFLSNVEEIIRKNISNERFGVSELASAIGMSRSNLLRRINKSTKLSASQFIRQVRLKEAMSMLKETSMNVSEISYSVGFASTSYFIKCFREYYGHPPGEVGKRQAEEVGTESDDLSEPGSGFWQELKRRKVVRVITVYAAAAFVILELFSIIESPLKLPEWTMALIIVLLVIGFIIAAILSWIYDVKEGSLIKTGKSKETGQAVQETDSTLRIWKGVTIASLIIIVGLVTYNLLSISDGPGSNESRERSIAVLPFKNDSNDSSNVYLINGLMESILNNFQKIEDLRVISRTSVEKYRKGGQTIPEIAGELDVNYLVEGSGQKRGDQVLLNIQLIDASRDKHIWSDQYLREANDIFALQLEVSKAIADEIQAIITPEEEEQINKVPTDDPVAYDYFLKGYDLLYSFDSVKLNEAIGFFEKAIEHDKEYADAYAAITSAYYFLDYSNVDKRFTDQISYYSDQGLLYDPNSAPTLIAKALYYYYTLDFPSAVPYLEKALEYNPNSAMVINILSDYYANIVPNSGKYLEYALKGVRLNIAANDSVTQAIIYLHISNAFIQSGFVDEAEKYIDLSLQYWPDNVYSGRVKPFIRFAQNSDLQETKDMLIEVLNRDSTNLDIMQEIGKIYYFMRDFENAYVYYKRFFDIRESLNLQIYPGEDAKIAIVFSHMGLDQEAEILLENYKTFAENNVSLYRGINLASYYSYIGEEEKAIEFLEQFSQEKDYYYWILLFMDLDPMLDNIRELPEYKELMHEIEVNFWENHDEIRNSLTKEGLL